MKLERQRKHLLFLLIRNLREQFTLLNKCKMCTQSAIKSYSIRLNDVYLERILSYGLMILLSKSTGCVVPLTAVRIKHPIC